ncbi:MAG: nitroreductase [Gammaproteobacteria bacterium]|nr:nitroreductase [Gammaproteobacteria bacterium]
MKADSVSASTSQTDIARSVDEAITSRHSVRAFLDEPVAKEVVHHLLDVARFAPSGTNTQPWHVYAIGGDRKAAMCREILADYETNGERTDREYEYYPTDWYEPYLGRRRACGWGLYGSLGIGREDRDRMHAQRGRNYVFFDAPVGLMFAIERRLETGSWMDLGMFIQNVMIAARGQGLHTCPQAAFANYHRIIRRHLGIPHDQIVVCGMAIGYRDPHAPENIWRTDREPVETFTRWIGFEE